VTAEVVRYGVERDGRVAPDARLVARDVALGPFGSRFLVTLDYQFVGEFSLAVPGLHNVRNALAAIGTGLMLGADPAAMARGLSTVRGAERRFQMKGVVEGVTVVDDYAHHPTEIEATVADARAAFPGRRLVVAFQPHLFSRTRDFAEGFASALAQADVVYLTDIYPAREAPIPGVTSGTIADPMARLGHAPAWLGGRGEVAPALAGAVQPGDVVLTMGAGDITAAGPELLRLLEATGLRGDVA
jgi:UDP-N-acetylmuramate--alanine ligase